MELSVFFSSSVFLRLLSVCCFVLFDLLYDVTAYCCMKNVCLKEKKETKSSFTMNCDCFKAE